MRSEAVTVEQYLAEMPEERRKTVEAVRQIILDNLPPGYEEVMNWGMITYQVPLETYPDTYNDKPLMYAALASQKNHMSLYLTGVYLDETARKSFVEQYRATGKKLDVAKSCVRFKKLEDLPLQLIGKTIAAYDAASFIARIKSLRKAAKQK
ncbi:MAG: DUF1801 domain-containing protein [Dehalococcoidaceae bacterium]|nr:DUF1801 domain-containing protein [Dehalococcoidaceae bacterium]